MAFVQAGVVLFASIYLWFIASFVDLAAQSDPSVSPSSRVDSLTTEATVLAVVQLVSVVLLVVAGDPRAHRAHPDVAWLLIVCRARRPDHAGRGPGDPPDHAPGRAPSSRSSQGALAAFTIVFAASPLVGAGMVLVGAGRRWFDGRLEGEFTVATLVEDEQEIVALVAEFVDEQVRPRVRDFERRTGTPRS